jgi:hypothetical protein
VWAARDSNPQRRLPTDLQSAPALQLRRPPEIINEQQIYFYLRKKANNFGMLKNSYHTLIDKNTIKFIYQKVQNLKDDKNQILSASTIFWLNFSNLQKGLSPGCVLLPTKASSAAVSQCIAGNLLLTIQFNPRNTNQLKITKFDLI